MKIIISLLRLLGIYSVIKGINCNNSGFKTYSSESLVASHPEINLPNFDVRERFRSCYNDGINANLNEKICYTNWPIQFSLIVSDKICIQKGGENRMLTSMNINTCMPLNGKIQNCIELRAPYLNFDSTFQAVNDTIKFFNTKGSQYDDEFPYSFLIDDDESPGYFPECVVDFNSSLNNITLNEKYEILEESVDLVKIKTLIFEEGPILAFLDTNRKDITPPNKAIYTPTPITELTHDGFKFLRVIGWRTFNGKTYWIFSYTYDKDWGLGNYKLIAQTDYNLNFLNLQLN